MFRKASWSVTLLFASSFIASLPAEELAQESVKDAAKNSQPDDSQPQAERWNAEADLQALNGRWQLTTEVPENPFEFRTLQDAKAIVRAVYANDSILVFKDGKFAIEGTEIEGAADNGMNKIEFRPLDNRWLNTNEPRLKLSLNDENSETLSYIVNKDQIDFRYPANSCSRSGVRFSFTRLPSENEVTQKSAAPTSARETHQRASELIAADKLSKALETVNSWTAGGEGRSMPKLLEQIHSLAIENGDTGIAVSALQQSVLVMVDKTHSSTTARRFSSSLRRLVELSEEHQPDSRARDTVAQLMQRVENIPQTNHRIDGTILARGVIVAQHARYLNLDGNRVAAEKILNDELIPNRTAIKEDDRNANTPMRVRAMVELLVVAQTCGNENCRAAELTNLLEKFTTRIPESRFVELYMQRQFHQIDKHVQSSPQFARTVLAQTEVRLQEFKDMKSFGKFVFTFDEDIVARRKRLGLN